MLLVIKLSVKNESFNAILWPRTVSKPTFGVMAGRDDNLQYSGSWAT